jgi:general secretion pathway protein D
MRDKDFPVVPPIPAGPNQGASPAANLLDLRQMTNNPAAHAQQQTAPQQLPPSQPQAVPQQQPLGVPLQPQQPQTATPGAPGAAQ